MLNPSSCIEISDLPSEIFPKIFKHLSVQERKNVKRVCKSWFESCNAVPLLDDEVITCRGLYKLSDIYELLDKSDRKFLNLKFENVRFDDGFSFWKNNGPRIRSINFYDCYFFNGILEEIVINCRNLYHLSFTYTAMLQYMVNDDSLPPIKDLEKVSGQGVVRESLRSLEINIINSNWMRLSDHTIHQLLLIYPKVKILNITSDFWGDDVHFNLTEIPSRNTTTMSPVLNYLIASTERIEKLVLYFSSAEFSPSALHFILETVSSLKRLTELHIGTRNTPRLEDIGTSLYSKQLQSLNFNLHLKSDDLMLFLSRLLNSNSSLQYLRIYQPYEPLIITKPFFEKLMSSRLKSFVVTATEVLLQDADTFVSHLPTQNRSSILPSLSVRMNFRRGRMLQFLQYSQNLHHLEIENISNSELQFLFKYQKNLRSFKVRSDQWMDYYETGADDLKNGFNQLTDIEYMEFVYAPLGTFLLRSLSPEPILPKMKYLFIDVQTADKELFPSDLLRAASAMPYLESLYVYNGKPILHDVCVELCTKLSRLQYFCFMGSWLVNDGDLTDEHYHKLFSVCSSLRVLIHYGCSSSKTYFLDSINNKVTLKLDDNRYHLGKPKIGEFFVGELTF